MRESASRLHLRERSRVRRRSPDIEKHEGRMSSTGTLQRHTSPAATKSEAMLGREDAMPARGEAMPVCEDAMPAREDAMPVREDAIPVREAAMPVRGVATLLRGT